MKKYDTYIFDLYGTLLDIHTDETIEILWEELSSDYRKKGIVYTADAIHKDYLRMVKEEEKALQKNTGYKYPEIKLEKVFERLFNEGFKANANSIDNKIDITDPWIQEIAVKFRETSRSKLSLFTNTVSTLNKLKNNGKKIYLLSNAQHCFTEPEMRQTGLWDIFDDIFISSDHEKKKPQPEFMEELIEKHSINKETAVMIGNDFTSDIRIALSCGIDSVFLNTDKYSDMQLKKMVKEELKNISNPNEVYIVKSGDIAEII